jgi:hypothetical protein
MIFWLVYSFVVLYLGIFFYRSRSWRWDSSVDNFDHKPVLFVKKICRLPFGWQLHLHKIVRADKVDCYHSHPAHAVRMILRGGYIEEIFAGSLDIWEPFRIGRIRPEFVHRIDILLGRASWSLWLRGPIVADIELFGKGWK